jgi:hypothetical protein
LEKKLESQVDGTSQLVKDCDLWREKYRKLVKDYNKLSDEAYTLHVDIERLRNRGFIDRLLNR